MHASWEALRVFLRQQCPAGTEAWVLSGSPEATRHLGLRRSQSLPFQTGQQDLRWLQYVIRDKSSGSSSRSSDDESSLASAEPRRRAEDTLRQQPWNQQVETGRAAPAPRIIQKNLERPKASQPKKKVKAASSNESPVENEWLI